VSENCAGKYPSHGLAHGAPVRFRRCAAKTWSQSWRLLYTFRSREDKMEIPAQSGLALYVTTNSALALR
jgi:hypothetical protein